jgi:acetyl-CoA carboxylase biotin carboxyl carrier protein
LSPPPLAEAEGPSRPDTAHPLQAPLSGIFYRAGSPDADPFVEVGQTIEAGTQIGLIEAMKVFSPIEADVSGTVVEFTARNGALVQHGEVLLYIDPIAT